MSKFGLDWLWSVFGSPAELRKEGVRAQGRPGRRAGTAWKARHRAARLSRRKNRARKRPRRNRNAALGRGRRR